jgi:hypothetical protein
MRSQKLSTMQDQRTNSGPCWKYCVRVSFAWIGCCREFCAQSLGPPAGMDHGSAPWALPELFFISFRGKFQWEDQISWDILGCSALLISMARCCCLFNITQLLLCGHVRANLLAHVHLRRKPVAAEWLTDWVGNQFLLMHCAPICPAKDWMWF